jgi:uncharacterized damage-inducible protein DinB
MTETERLIDELQRAADGDPWHGPSLRDLLDDLDVHMANARPIAGAHTISELVLHVTAWTREVTRRMHDGVARDPVDGDWPPSTIATDEDWNAALAAFDAANAGLVAAVAAAGDAQLDERVRDLRDPSNEGGVSRYVTLHGIAQHHAYHGGQISLLKAALLRR